MRLIPPFLPGEARPTALLASLLFINTLVLESNEVIATSGFVSNVGVDQILLVWAAVMLIAMLTSSAYALFVDRVDRARLGVLLFLGASIIYLGFYFLFTAGAPAYVAYGLLAIFTEQQWTLLPLVIWALASDLFSVAAAKRIFPVLATVVIVGGVAGNAIAATVGQWLGERSFALLVFNGLLLMLGTGALFIALPRLQGAGRQSEQSGGPVQVLREGLEFVRNVPAYRFLAIAMVLMGFCLNTLQYEFLVDLARIYTDPGQLQTFYAIFKLASVPVMLVVQSAVTPRLLNQHGFKSVFAWMPGSTFLALLLAFFWLNPLGGLAVTGAIVGNYLVRLVLTSIDQPARQAFQGLVPDQRRGRVSALMEGFLYQGGSVLSCLYVGGLLLLVRSGWLPTALGRALSIGTSLACALIALLMVRRLYISYEESMLNWRLKRRQHGRSVLDQLKF